MHVIAEVYPLPAVESLANIPERFTQRPQWVNWRYAEDEKGGWTKHPYNPRTGRKASSTDLMTWSAFDQVVEAVDDYDGVGFVLCSADPFVAIDLDDVRDPESGAIEPWAVKIIKGFTEAYVEVSPSGRGVHIITRGRHKGGHNKKPIELYGQDRYITMTGVAL